MARREYFLSEMAEIARFCGVWRGVAEFVPSLLVWYVLSGAIDIFVH